MVPAGRAACPTRRLQPGRPSLRRGVPRASRAAAQPEKEGLGDRVPGYQDGRPGGGVLQGSAAQREEWRRRHGHFRPGGPRSIDCAAAAGVAVGDSPFMICCPLCHLSKKRREGGGGVVQGGGRDDAAGARRRRVGGALSAAAESVRSSQKRSRHSVVYYILSSVLFLL